MLIQAFLGFLRNNIKTFDLFQWLDIYVPITAAAKTFFADRDALKVRYIFMWCKLFMEHIFFYKLEIDKSGLFHAFLSNVVKS